MSGDLDSDIDAATKKELLDKRNNILVLKQYIGHRVLEKKQAADGEMRYEFLPGSAMYRLMLELFQCTRPNDLLVMLPFMHPMLMNAYRKYNPGMI